jgi:uncharacterized OB-fold protein
MEKNLPASQPHEAVQRSSSQRLVASRRRSSGALVFPRVPDSSPAAPDFEPVDLSASATLYSFTTIHPNPKTGEPPFTLAYADFSEGVRVFGRLQFPRETAPKIGMLLDVVVRAATQEDLQYYFVPANEVES